MSTLNYATLADDTFRYLSNCQFAQSVPIVNIETDADGLLARDYLIGEKDKSGNKGVCVTMLPPIGTATTSTGPQLTVGVIILVQVNLEANNTTYTADSLAMDVLNALNHVHFDGAGSYYVDQSDAAIQPNLEFLPFITREVKLKNTVVFDPPQRCKLPSIICPANTVTLTVDGNDSCYYTLDGTFPDPAYATEYTAPFTATSGTIVRWAAYNPNKNPSAVGQATITN